MIIETAQFKKSFLLPKYWLLWIGYSIFRLIMLLPYSLLLKIANFLSWIFLKLSVGKKRSKIIKKNLELCFKDLSDQELDKLTKSNIQETGMGIISTGMAWFWSDKRIAKYSKVSNLEIIQKLNNTPTLMVGVHFLALELGARILSLYVSGIGIYRPHNNPLMEYFQVKGRLKSADGLVAKDDIKGIIKALKSKKMIWYAPDQDYGLRSSVFVPFFDVKNTASTKGSYFLLKKVPESNLGSFAIIRESYGYRVDISKPTNFSLTNEFDIALILNKIVEKEILKAKDQYLWMHKRFKTRPEGENSYY
ncbi:MAG: LpxL/LpxP family Kdo(2)-lipid IV(A) lauroyl/palmitoleoyl acyltransferase [Psittacicella sp.]